MVQVNSKLEEILKKQYESVVDKELKTADKIKEKNARFQRINDLIEGSISRSLNNHASNLQAIEKQYTESLARLKVDYQANIKRAESDQKTITKRYKKDIQSLNDDLEKKRSLNTLKTQKTIDSHDFKVKAIHDTNRQKQEDSERKIEDAHTRYTKNIDELETRTALAHETNKNALKQEDLRYTQTHEEIKENTEKKLKTLNQELNKDDKAFKDALVALKKEYKEVLKPLDKEIESIEKQYENELSNLKRDYDDTISKNEKYLKEAEKINDTSRASELTKKIKQLKKEYVSKRAEKETEYSQTLEPELNTKKETIERYRNKFSEAKASGIETIRARLYEIEQAKTEEYILIDEANTKFNISKARADQTKENINLDDAIQKLNYRQTDEENDMFYSFEKAQSTPKTTLTETELTYALNLEKNTLNLSLETFNLGHIKDVALRDLIHAFDLEKIELEFKKMHAYFEYDTLNINLARTNKMIAKDTQKEAMLLSHYYTQSKNYTALKADEMKLIKPMLEKELKNRTKLKIDHYNAHIKAAQKDHEAMVSKIEAMYANEITMYQDSYDSLEKEHQEAIEHMMTRQAIERNKDLEKISVLDLKKDKTMIKRMKKDLAEKQQHHDESLALSKKELDSKLKHYADMIQAIKNAKIQSLEEADTLLNHIVDQTKSSIDETRELEQKELNNYEQLFYKIKHSADLFQTFQLQRQEDTNSLAKDYAKTRLDKSDKQGKQALSHLDDQLANFKKRFNQYEEDNKKMQREAQDTYQKAFDAITKKTRDYEQDLEDEYIDEKRRLELYISKLERTYHDDLQKLRKSFKEEENYLFSQKHESEKKLESEIERLNTELDKEKKYKHLQLEDKNKMFEAVKSSLNELIKDNPIEILSDNKVPWVKAVLRQEETSEILK